VNRQQSGRLQEISAALLLGGASRRMGCDKATLSLRGVPLATHLARLLAPLFGELLLVGGAPPADTPGRRVTDPEAPPCALRGLVGALEAAATERVLLVATDLPALSADLLLALVALPGADAVVPRAPDGRLQPLCALYRREATLAMAHRNLAGGRLRLGALMEALTLRVLEGEDLLRVDPGGRALTNVNTPEQWRALLGATS